MMDSLMGRLLIDVTDFIGNPIRRGIQRVIRELLKHWPDEVEKQVVRFDARVGGFLTVHDDLVRVLIDSAEDEVFDIDRLRRKSDAFLSLDQSTPIDIGPNDRVLLGEMFVNLARSRYYHSISQRGVQVAAIVYDFLPWTQPTECNVVYVGGFNDYLTVLDLASRRCHIAQAVSDDYVKRFIRRESSAETVITLGADALGVRAADTVVKSQLVCLGGLDGRKGQDRVYQAYLACPASERIPLIFAGRIPDRPRDVMLPLLNTNCPTVSIVDDPDDNQLADLIASSRGAFFPSQFEGFGLPALESLYLGTPVVVDASLPAISGLPAAGQIRLETADEEEMIRAIMRMSSQTDAQSLREEVSTLRLPTWAGYAQQVASWAVA
jgi:glycosyltransferase involved in cell wall biosynthesis